jgi:DNA-directed RNA polymerase subunit RPC12/RpoP
MSGESIEYTCSDCGKPDARDMQSGALPCLHCGKKSKRVVLTFTEDKIDIREEIDGEFINRDGELVGERLQRGDGNVEASLATDRGQPTILSAWRKERISGFDEEGPSAEALAKAYNAQKGTNYTVRPKPREDGDYVDRYLDSKNDEPKELSIQIRHLDTEIIAQLGKKDEFDVKRTVGDLAESINKAIDAKANVDPKLKLKTILLLQLPVMLGKLVREELQGATFELKGFKGAWLAPFREECFEVFGQEHR